VALILPKVFPTPSFDQVTFGWTFLPDANPRFAGSLVQASQGPAAPRH
jgi:hypothetical protein